MKKFQTTVKIFFFLLLGTVSVTPFCGAVTDDTNVSTYYPSPSGKYNLLTTTDTTQIASTGGDVIVGNYVGGGKVGVKTSTPAYPLEVSGTGTHSSLYSLNGNKYGIGIGSGIAGGSNYASIQAQVNNAGTAPLILNPEGGNVAIGGNVANPQYTLHVGGVGGKIGILQGGNPAGELKVGYANDGQDGYFAVFAPD